MEIFRFWKNRELAFSKDVYTGPLYFSRSTPRPSQVFHFLLSSNSLAILSQIVRVFQPRFQGLSSYRETLGTRLRVFKDRKISLTVGQCREPIFVSGVWFCVEYLRGDVGWVMARTSPEPLKATGNVMLEQGLDLQSWEWQHPLLQLKSGKVCDILSFPACMEFPRRQKWDEDNEKVGKEYNVAVILMSLVFPIRLKLLLWPWVNVLLYNNIFFWEHLAKKRVLRAVPL